MVMCNQKNKVRIEIDIIEHKYWATDEDYDFLDLFILDGTEGYADMRIYVDGKLVDFDDKDIKEEFLAAKLTEKYCRAALGSPFKESCQRS